MLEEGGRVGGGWGVLTVGGGWACRRRVGVLEEGGCVGGGWACWWRVCV